MHIEHKAKLPKGYVAYDTELRTLAAAVDSEREKRAGKPDKIDMAEWHREREAVKEQSMQMAKEIKDWDVAKKIDQLKALTTGGETTFVFEKSAPQRPCRGSGRAAGSR